MDLQTLWFGIVVFFWVGYLVLEGFDFGVGMLTPLLGRTDRRRSEMLGTIGPHWDANEVWMIVAVGAMFAAFPGWYADMTSGAYAILTAIIAGLIVRGVCLEYRGERSDRRWRRSCELGIAVGSLIPPLGWGTVLTGSVAGGVVLLALCLAHGWTFLRLRLPPPDRSDATVTGPVPFILTTALIAVGTVAVLVAGHDSSVLADQAAGDYGLRVLTAVSVLLVPPVIAYQVIGYRVFRRRVAG